MVDSNDRERVQEAKDELDKMVSIFLMTNLSMWLMIESKQISKCNIFLSRR